MNLAKLTVIACAFLLQSNMNAAQIETTETIPNVCYDTVDNTLFCTTDNLGKVQVYIYNAGWCPPCNSEMRELAQRYPQFEGKDVVFASLSGEGFSHGSKPDKAFLEQWRAKHKIPFVVAGKYKDFGKNFNANGSIPFTAIIDQEGHLVASDNMSPDEIIAKVNQLLKNQQLGSCLPVEESI